VAIRDFAGEARVTTGTIAPASLRLIIKAGSLAETEKGFSASDRQKIDSAIREEALDGAKYPQIVFKSTRISVTRSGGGNHELQIAGELTLHGVTRPITKPTHLSFAGNDLTARGVFTVRHSDYQIKRIRWVGGMVTAQDEMTLSFNILGFKH
jgi:polyisoprenoid-binding protein YceI